MYYGDEDQNEIMKEIDEKYHDPFEDGLLENELTDEQKSKIIELEKQTVEKLTKLEEENLPY